MSTIVCDTNVLVSATFWKGTSRRVLQLVNEGKTQLAISLEIFNEYNDVVQRDEIIEKTGPDYSKAISKTRQLLVEQATWVRPTQKLQVVKEDPADDKVLEASLEAKTHAIVTYDPHLLKLKSFQNIQIRTRVRILPAYQF